MIFWNLSATVSATETINYRKLRCTTEYLGFFAERKQLKSKLS
ncbi:hypothetical protein HanXRQr2_Chr03g0108691 [Helianthus annuus]|uniref:Uncharacterized protein n=1 Tax=Helianthus annuus TaxID=4232 RepID=A0A9K3JF33_HELAN|nr:hypothetical protein HanXRQr2_Chr03g0108691 [Helianthus annuus]KAJ0943477.1 hypothetical protein HanPSC8_Chr03g0105211 [Helianthus annuus]